MLAGALGLSLPLEVRPCGKHQQDDRDDPEGRIAHSCFLSHEPHFKPGIASVRNHSAVDGIDDVNQAITPTIRVVQPLGAFLGSDGIKGRPTLLYLLAATTGAEDFTLKQEQHPKVKVMPELTREWVTSLKAQNGKDVWLMGGSSLFRSFLDFGCVERIDVMVIPVVLGAGIPMLPAPYSPTKLKLLSNRVYRSGKLSLAYKVQR